MTFKICKDPDDDKFLETAVVGNGNYLVTKNIKHFPIKSYENIQIVGVSKFLSHIEKSIKNHLNIASHSRKGRKHPNPAISTYELQ